MNSRTYYDILGVSREATLQEITSAKNALAKVYHPDANMNQGIDTTACMQEILEAYRVLSNPESRHEYDKELGGGQIRVFRTFTVCRILERCLSSAGNRRSCDGIFGEQLPEEKTYVSVLPPERCCF